LTLNESLINSKGWSCHLAGDLRIGVRALAPPATFDPGWAQNFPKNDSQSEITVRMGKCSKAKAYIMLNI